ncbi:hypothetical protein SOVF_023130, partial [Spinacia oleracea]
WNSTYLMLSAAISLESAFERYAEEDPHYTVDLGEREGKGISESEDWNSVKKFSEFVQTFYDLTNRVSGSLYVTSNLFFHELVNVAVLLKELTSSDDPDMCLMACKMKEKYEKYWGDPEKINLMIFVVVVLDPRYKFDYVEWMLTEIYDVITASIWARNVKDILSALFEEYRILPQTDVVREEVSSTKDDTQLTTSHKKVEVLKSKYKKHKCEPSGAAKIELDKYLEEDKRTMMNLIFWGGRSSIVQRFPTMGRMARDVLAVPISTVASESAFSTKGRVLDNFRSSLSPVVVQGLVCNQNWLRAGPFQGVEECLEEVELLEEEDSLDIGLLFSLLLQTIAFLISSEVRKKTNTCITFNPVNQLHYNVMFFFAASLSRFILIVVMPKWLANELHQSIAGGVFCMLSTRALLRQSMHNLVN